MSPSARFQSLIGSVSGRFTILDLADQDHCQRVADEVAEQRSSREVSIDEEFFERRPFYAARICRLGSESRETLRGIGIAKHFENRTAGVKTQFTGGLCAA